MGAGIALQIAIRHPERVRKLVAASTVLHAYDGMHAEAIEMFPTITPELFGGSPMEAEYKRARAATPDDFREPRLEARSLSTRRRSIGRRRLRAITAPTLIVVGDSDVVRLDHAVELFRLLGGGVMGDLAGLPKSQLAVLPGTSHFMPPGSGVLDRAEWLLAMIPTFLDPAPAEG